MTKEEYKNKIRHLVQNKNKTEEELDKLVEKYFSTLEFSISNNFVDKEEKKRAEELLLEYRENFTIENVSEKGNLHNLVYMKILANRIQNSINKVHKGGKAIPAHEIDTLNKTLDKIAQLEKELNISGEDKDSYNIIKKVKKKHKIWRENNQGTRTRICPACGKMIMWKIRTDAWDMQKHPFFKDRILGNKHLIKLYKLGTITALDVAKVLETSENYTPWLITKWKEKEQLECEHIWTEGFGGVVICENCEKIKESDGD